MDDIELEEQEICDNCGHIGQDHESREPCAQCGALVCTLKEGTYPLVIAPEA